MIKEQFVKFIVIGGFATIVNYGIYFCLLKLFGINHNLAYIIGFVSGVLAGFGFNRDWTFKATGGVFYFHKYIAIYSISLLLGMGFINLFIIAFKVSPELANIFTIVITTCTNFLGTKLLVFKK